MGQKSLRTTVASLSFVSNDYDIWTFSLPELFSRLLSSNVMQLKFPNHLKACEMGISTLSVCVCGNGRAGRQGGRELDYLR